MESEKPGMREFREQPGTHLKLDSPVAITTQERGVGSYIPLRRQVELEDREALREAGRRLDAWMVEHKIDAEALAAEFDRARKAGHQRDR